MWVEIKIVYPLLLTKSFHCEHELQTRQSFARRWDSGEWKWHLLNFPSVLCCAQSCPALCDPTDCSLLDSSVHGIPQARTLEWIAISSSRGSSQPRDQTHVSCVSCIGGQIFYHCATQEAHGNGRQTSLATRQSLRSLSRKTLNSIQGHKKTWISVDPDNLSCVKISFI